MGPLPRRRMRFFVYIRVSTEREKMCSPKIQEKGCDRYAAKYGIDIVEVVLDLDKTGRDFADRKISDLIRRVRNGEADGILIFRINRWGREAEGCMTYLKELIAAGGQLLSTKESIDMNTSAGRKAIRDAFSDAEYESDVIGDNWRAAHEDRWDNGFRHSGREMFGYRRCDDCRRRKDKSRAFEACDSCDGVPVVDERTADTHEGETTAFPRSAAIAEFYPRVVSGTETMSAVVGDMARRGVRSLNGNVMDAQAWYRVLDTGFAAGYVRRKSEAKRDETTTHKPHDYDIWFKGVHDTDELRLCSEETWTAYKKWRAAPRSPSRPTAASKFVSGMMKCYREGDNGEACTGNMVSYTMRSTSSGKARKKTTTRGFRCSVFVRTKGCSCKGVTVSYGRVEQAVLAFLDLHAAGSESMDEKVRAAAAMMATGQAEAVAVEKKLTKLTARRKDLKDLYTDPDSGMSAADYNDTLSRFNVQIAKLELELDGARRRATAVVIPPPQVFRGIREEWPRITEDRKRQMLGHVIDRIEVRRRGPGERSSNLRVVGVWDAA